MDNGRMPTGRHGPGKATTAAGQGARRPPRGMAAVLRHLPVALFSGLFVYAVCLKASREPLRYDEIFTYYVAKLGSARDIVEALLAKMDNHPPLDYLVRHFSMAVLGPTDFALRVPSVIGLLAAALAVYVFVLRRTSLVPALLAFSIPFTTEALFFAYEARGYAFLMAGMCLALLAWQLAAERPSAGRLVFLTLALSLGPFSHYYGVLNYLPIAAGEAWRCRERRAVSWPIVACFALSLLSLCALVPFATHAYAYSRWFWTNPSPAALIESYSILFHRAVPGVIGALLAFALVAVLPDRASDGRSSRLPRHEIVAAVVLCLLPFVIYVLAVTVTHAYVPKYGLNAVFGVAILAAFAVHRIAERQRLLALLTAAAVGLWAVALVASRGMSAPVPSPANDRVQRLIAESPMPVVVIPHFAFLALHRYLPPDLRDRIFFVADRKLHLAYKGSDTTYRALENLSRFVPMNFVNLCAFTTEHQAFLIAQYEPFWLTEKLLDDGARLILQKQDIGAQALFAATLSGPSGC